jgi:hypothetical protein
MPVEHLWHWLREDLTYHTCYNKISELIAQVERFQARLNDDPIALAHRFGPPLELILKSKDSGSQIRWGLC